MMKKRVKTCGLTLNLSRLAQWARRHEVLYSHVEDIYITRREDIV